MFFCYILECVESSFHVGIADDPQRRVEEHSQGRGAEWAATRRPVNLVWTEEHLTLASARQREMQLKRGSNAKKAALVRGSLRRSFPRAEPRGSGQTPAQNT
jgi:predicted GIY-YIG superfamily endonuclease